MAELRLVGLSEDGRHLVLTDDDGAQHTVEVDERLRAAVNGHVSRLGQLTMALESRISPRDIQSRIRAGESAEHVALTAGVPIERVLRFVGPVLREREHVAEQARRARLGRPGGPASLPGSLLGDVVDRAASRRGVDPADTTWDAARRDDHTWVVTVSWPDGASAQWSFDVGRHLTEPIDATARRLSGVVEEAPEPDAGEAGHDTSGEHERDERRENVRPFVLRSARGVREAGPESSDAEEVDAELSFDGSGADAQPADAVEDDGDDERTSTDETTETVKTDETAGTRARPAARSRTGRRASVPKWDDIMFGMKPKDS